MKKRVIIQLILSLMFVAVGVALTVWGFVVNNVIAGWLGAKVVSWSAIWLAYIIVFKCKRCKSRSETKFKELEGKK